METSQLQKPQVNILVLDDEPGILTFLGKCLKKHGYGVETTTNADTALKLLNKQTFDLLLTDIKMPGTDGMTILKKTKESHPIVEVMLMTGYPSMPSSIGAMQLGALDYLIKPFNVNQVLEAVEKTIKRMRSIREVYQNYGVEKTKKDFLRIAGHELRMPVAIISSALSMLIDDFKEDGENIGDKHSAKLLTVIKRTSDKMVNLIEDLMDTFQSNPKTIALNRVPLSISKMVEECAEEFKTVCRIKGLTLSSDVEKDMSLVMVDPVKIRQTILNLIGNAMKFTFEGGKITLVARNCRTNGANPDIEILVKDTGAGIAPSEQKKIFDMFYSVDCSKDKRIKGFGLGLTLVKSIVEAHNGTISVDSTPGKGSTFSIRIPAVTNGSYQILIESKKTTDPVSNQQQRQPLWH